MRDAGGCTAWPVHHGTSSHTSRAIEQTLATIETTPLGGGTDSVARTNAIIVGRGDLSSKGLQGNQSDQRCYMAPPATPPTTRLDAQSLSICLDPCDTLLTRAVNHPGTPALHAWLLKVCLVVRH